LPSTLERLAVPKNLDESILNHARRQELLDRAFELRSGRERPGQFWKIDLDALDFSPLTIAAPSSPRISDPNKPGVIACDLATAAQKHAQLFSRAFGIGTGALNYKFAALATALCNAGAFVYIPADLAVDEPIEITYAVTDGALFPYTLVLLERGAHCTIVERVEGRERATVCGVAEIVCAENASVTYAAEQTLPADAQSIFTRVAAPGKDASVTWCVAELGAALAVTSVDVLIDNPGVQAQLNGFFFPSGEQHVDLVSTIRHNVGESQSETLIKSAATGRGQGRYVGNIRIAKHAQGTAASLRDDALLLSPKAHIDSVPALEIGANDVKAFHGATIGALDENVIFYMESRGIARDAAEKMVALGFFEPVLERFPTSALRDRLRLALEAKIA
jgi:Fe-S cluster assembly protein SufD